MKQDNAKKLFRGLINNVYNNVDLSDDILDEVTSDLKKIKKLVGEDKFYRELLVLIEAAKTEKNMIARNNLKFAILSDLEKEYKKISSMN